MNCHKCIVRTEKSDVLNKLKYFFTFTYIGRSCYAFVYDIVLWLFVIPLHTLIFPFVVFVPISILVLHFVV